MVPYIKIIAIISGPALYHVTEIQFVINVKSDTEKKYMMIDTSQGFHDRLTNILSRSKNQFCEKIDRDHNFAYMLIILGFPMVIFGPLLFMGAASVLNELCDKWELGHLEVNEEYRRDRDNNH